MELADVFAAEGVPRFLIFVLVFFRIMGLFILAPFFGSESIPPPVKIGLAALTAIIIVPLVHARGDELPQGLGDMFAAVVLETLVGLVMGLSASLVFSLIQFIGHHIGQQMGITIASVIDPISNEQVTLVGQLKFLLGILIFLGMDGHLFMLRVLAGSFQAIPLMGEHFPRELIRLVAQDQFGHMVYAGALLAAPVMVGLLLVTVAEGFIARAVPEINMFTIGFGLRIGLGLGMLLVLVPYLAPIFRDLFLDVERDLLDIVALMRG